VPGVLGGASGTTHDAFHLLEDAKKHGARAALFGRKIKDSEHQLSLVRWLRAIADDEISATDAVKAYHDDLRKLNIAPLRALKDDLELTGGKSNSYSSSARSASPPKRRDFSKMSSAEKVAYARARLRA